MLSNYQRMLIYKSIHTRIKQAKEAEIKSLADGMGVSELEIRKVYKEEKKKRI